MKTIKKQYWTEIKNIATSNTKLNRDVVEKIKENFDWEKVGAIPGVFTSTGKFYITDGNHRTQALKELSHAYAPIIILTPEEYDYIAFSDRSIDFMVEIPPRPVIAKVLFDA